MKNEFINLLKEKTPIYFNKLIDCLDIFLIYQAIIFILSPSKIMGVILGIIFLLFIINNKF